MTAEASHGRFVGTVLGNGRVLHDATLMVGGERSSKSSLPCAFDLRTEDGRAIRVEASRSTVAGPRTVLEGEWREVSSAALAALFASETPGDPVKVKLSGVLVTAGEEVAVEGDVVGGGDPGVAATLKARSIGIGPDAKSWVWARADRAAAERAEKQAEARAPASGGLSVWPAIPLALFGLAAIVHAGLSGAVTEPSHVFSVRARQVIGLFLLTLALFLWRRRRFTLRMLQADPRTSGDVLWWIRPWATYLVGIGLPGSLVLAATSLEGSPLGVAGFFGALVVSATLWGVLIVETRADARALRTIAATRPASGDGWGRRAGVVAEGELRRQRTHRKTSTTTRGSAQVRDAVTGALHTVETSDTSTWYKAFESSGAGKLKVRLGERTIEVDLFGKARWGTTRRSIKKLTLTESLRAGDHVLLVGRIEDGTMRGKGRDSLFVLGADHGDVNGVAVRELTLHWIGMLGFAAVIAVEIWLLFTG